MKLIDKEKIVAEIKSLSAYFDNLHEQRIIEKILSIIDTLEVKEVDLKKEFDKCCENYIFDDEYEVYTARHFFEFGLKTQKGE